MTTTRTATRPPVPLSLCKGVDGLDGINPNHHIMEPKLDGIRIQMVIDGGTIRCYTRSEHDATGKMVAVETALAPYIEALDGTVLDGEAVYINAAGSADFNFTARCMGSGVDNCIQKQRLAGQYVSFVAFDIIACRGTDTRPLPLADRRNILETLVAQIGSSHIRITEQVAPTVENHRRFTAEYGEGSVIKDLRASYTGTRGKAMLKWKKTLDEDVVVIGAEPGKGKFATMLGAVVFGQHGTPSAGHTCTTLCSGTLHERGRCSGMTDAVRQQLTDALPVGAVMVVTHNGHQVDGFRHPQFSHFRTDKRADQCEWTVAP